MSFRIDDDEFELLAGDGASRLSHAAKVAYTFGIRPWMDYRTGMAGWGRRISYQSLRELLEYAPSAGSTRTGSYASKEAIRGVLRELERAGLIRWLKSPERGLFFVCLRAARDSSTEKRTNTRATPEQPHSSHPNNNPDESSIDAGLMGGHEPEDQHRSNPTKSARSNTPPVSGIPVIQDSVSLQDSARATRRGQLSVLLRSLGVQVTTASPDLVAWVSRDLLDDEAREAVERARQYKPAPLPIPARYLNPIVVEVLDEREQGRKRPQGPRGVGSAVDRVERAIAEREARERAGRTAGDDAGAVIDLGVGEYFAEPYR